MLETAPQIESLDQLGDSAAAQSVRALMANLLLKAKLNQDEIKRYQEELKFKQAHIEKLGFEIARLKQWRFGSSSESMDGQVDLFGSTVQESLVEESKGEDAAEEVTFAPVTAKRKAKRQALPTQLERKEQRFEIEPAVCALGHPLKRIGEEVSEQLDCIPAQFFVHRFVRGKYVCACCQTIVAAPMPAQVIDKGIPAPGLLAQVIIAKYDDHLPLYRQEEIYRRSGVEIARSSMASWVGQCGAQLQPIVQALRAHILNQSVIHADETSIKLLAPGTGKTDTAYAWVYRTSDLEQSQKAVFFDFCTSRQGMHPKRVLVDYTGTLVVDDYAGYKALFKGNIQEAGCWAHVRRKFFEAHKLTHSELAKQALEKIQTLYRIEHEARDRPPDERLQMRQQKSAPLLEKFKGWLLEHRPKVPGNTATAKAMDYALSRWQALCVHLQDAKVPIDNNAVENAIRPIALGRKNWLFVGSEQAGKRAANLLSLIESAKLNGHDPWVYLKDILTKLPTWPNSKLEELLPHRWIAPTTT